MPAPVTSSEASPDSRRAPRADLTRRLGAAVAAPVVALTVLGILLGVQILDMSEDARWVDHTDEVLSTANETLKQIIDQETGARGFLVTGDRLFLEPFQRAHPAEGFARLRDLVADSPAQQARFEQARRRHELWLDWLTPFLEAQDLDAARADETMRDGKMLMDGVRDAMRAATDVEEGLRRERVLASRTSTDRTKALFVALFGGSAVLLAFFSRRQMRAIGATFGAALDAETRARHEVEAEAWVRAGLARVVHGLQGDKTIAELGAESLATLAIATGADVGAFFTREGATWRRRAGYSLDARVAGAETFQDGEGLVGRAAHEAGVLRITDVPPDFLKVRGGTGEADPAEVILVPARSDGVAVAVLELGYLRRVEPRAFELLQRIGESVAVAVRSAENKRQLRELLEETQRQAEELQTQQEELRVANEELETQATAQKATQRELEGQQAELQQTNRNLVEQSEELERQNRDLAEARADVAAKVREVERASQFKSEFLSNMSHELRTPLNSSLIMAKLLADNRTNNLTADQVKFAETIYSAGNDLLALINDILDLSKIEAGKLDVHPGPVGLERVRTNLLRTFEPVAEQKDLRFTVSLLPGAPASIETDAHRLEQVLKNLVSNALKFTEKGAVSIEIAARPAGVAFAVHDTGIGIPAEQQTIIFEAFRQADGTTNRKYGGTGLGLSISRELARLLGGEIAVASEVGRGSSFVLTLPAAFGGPVRGGADVLEPSSPAPSGKAPASIRVNRSNGVAHASTHAEPAIEPGERFVLIVEDDDGFSHALAAVAKDAGFKSLVANTGAEGLRLAKKLAPMGIVLDMKLPDHSGLSVLDRLKRDPMTRHVPVHVISATDFTEAALSMGAVAYLLKPVQRDQLVQALKTLEARSDHRVRRVLVVEDDTELRESVARLLERSDVEITTAANAEDALGFLRDRTFDCVVTDLGMPGASGYDLIETMATQERYSVPPVIVYTGRALSPDEEQRLRKHSKSIIVKGARSPERLLDEVTLFLHQVESELPPDQQRLLKEARHREAVFEGRTILVVEDDVRNVFAMTSVLEPKGARVAIARNGREALAALEKEPADLVLMDIMMPEMDGLEATREIRKKPAWRRIPIIALTAKAMRDDQEKCLAAGANDYLAKPLDIEMLLSLLRVWMPKT
jgi:CheY-like chemotaxis protein/signal transduction histidine kinase/CHASE3 domain sensor protein